MTVYLLTIATTVIIGALIDKTKEDERYKSIGRFLLALLIILLSFVIGTRFWVGTDYGGYVGVFNYWKNKPFIDVFSEREPGIKLIIKFSALFSNDSAVFMSIYALICTAIPLVVIYNRADKFLFGAIIYILIGTYLSQCNGMRQAMAASIVFAGYKYLKGKRFLPFLLLTLIAMQFHVSAVVMIPLYFVYVQKPSVPLIIIIAAVALALRFSYDKLFDAIAWLKEESEIVTDSYGTTNVNILRIAVAFAPMLFYLILYLTDKTLLPDNNVLINATIVNAFLYFFSSGSAYLARVGMFSEIFMCLSIPTFTEKMDERDKKITIAVILICYAAYFYFNTTMTSALTPYRSVIW